MKKLVLLSIISVLACISARASVTVEQSTDPEYLINSGYSEAVAEDVMISKNRVNGQPAEPLYSHQRSKFARFWRNLYGYIDPTIDTDEVIHHDISRSPSWKDL